jgi:hypothetical protein
LSQVAVELGMRSKQLAHYTAKVAGRKLGIERSLVEALQRQSSAPGMGIRAREASQLLSAAGAVWSAEQVRGNAQLRAAVRRAKRPLSDSERRSRELDRLASQLLKGVI